jgi:hypothetical protein
MSYECKFCHRGIKNKGSLVAHEKVCPGNPERVKYQRSPKAGAQKGSVPWNKGLSADVDVRVATTAAKNAVILKGRPGKKHTNETRMKMSESRKRLYESGWESTAGRTKKIRYTSPIAGDVTLDGSWELRVAKHLDSIGVKWVRNKARFPYVRPDGKSSTYQPDFFVSEWNTYIEVKGYETDIDRAKWGAFPHDLQIWRKAEIESLEG